MATKTFKDSKGKFEVKVDTGRRVCFEKFTGTWTKDEFDRLNKVYKEAVDMLNTNGVKDWAKLTDVREYKTSNIGEEIAKHVEWASKQGYTKAALIVDKVVNKMQVNRVAGKILQIASFKSIEEGDNWLKENGF